MRVAVLCALILLTSGVAASLKKLRIPPGGLKVKARSATISFSAPLFVVNGYVGRKRSGGLFSRFRGSGSAKKPGKRGLLSSWKRPRTTKPKPAAGQKSGWLAKIKGRLSIGIKPKKGIFKKDAMLEELKVSGAPVNEHEEMMWPGSGKEPPLTSNGSAVFDEIRRRLFLERIHKFGDKHVRGLIHVTIAGKPYRMLLDTGSSTSMIPQRGCTLNNTQRFGLDEPLYHPPANDNPAQLPTEEQFYMGSGPDRPQPGFEGKIRNLPVIIAGKHIQANIVTATTIQNWNLPMMGASSHISRTNLAYQVLVETREPLKRFTVFFEPQIDPTPDAQSGTIVFGGRDHSRCDARILYLRDNSSTNRYDEEDHTFWSVEFDSLHLNGQSAVERPSDAEPLQALADTGSPHLYFPRNYYNRLIRRFHEILGVEDRTSDHPEGLPVVQCSIPAFVLQVRLRGRVGGVPRSMDIPIHSKHLLRPVPNTRICESACVVHDFDRMRMGFAPFI